VIHWEISRPFEPLLKKTFVGISRFLLIALLAACGLPQEQLAGTPPDLKIEVVLHGLDTPWALDFAPDGRLFITERPGRIRTVEGGRLMGLALDPQFAKNHFVYVAHTYRAANGRLQNRLVRLREDPKTSKGLFDQVLINNVAGSNNHDGGRVKFGADGKLYWTVGDAQTARLAQNLSSLNGKILRLNPDGTVPVDNPFPQSYVYSYGHRNPQGLAWQPGTKRLYSTEHGPSGFQGCCRDELNYIEPGKNYGWAEIRGDETREGMISPIIESGTSETWAPTGATFVTHGPWTGSLLFTGLRGQTLYRVVVDPQNPRKVEALERHLYRQFGRLRDVVEGPDGNLYLLTSNRDGRGSPKDDDDRMIRLSFK
jgi:aldose sugar dehydrogenase